MKSQNSVRGTVPGFGEGTLAEARTFSAFNQLVEVAPPPAAQVQAMRLHTQSSVIGSR